MEPYCVLLRGSAYQGCVNKGPPVCTIISCSMLDIFCLSANELYSTYDG